MSCKCGVEKKSTAPDQFNVNQIGSICFLIGAEGDLCRFADLIPSAIKKIAGLLKPDKDADKVFFDLLIKVTRKAISLGDNPDINTENFCQTYVPSPPPEIQYQDVFRFIAELVPFLNFVYATTDVILDYPLPTLLDKIVQIWIYKKYYQYCDCKDCPKEDNPPENTIPPSQPEPSADCPNGQGTGYLKPIYVTGDPTGRSYRLSYGRVLPIAISTNGFYSYASANGTQILISKSIGFNELQAAQDALNDSLNLPRSPFVLPSSNTLSPSTFWNIGIAAAWNGSTRPPSFFYSEDGINWTQTTGLIPSSTVICPPPPFTYKDKKKEKPTFCALFPDDPLCQEPDPDNENCQIVNVVVSEWIDKGLTRPSQRTLNQTGQAFTVKVIDPVSKLTKDMELLDCSTPSPTPDPPPPNVDCDQYFLDNFSYNPYFFDINSTANGNVLSQLPDEYTLCDWIAIYEKLNAQGLL